MIEKILFHQTFLLFDKDGDGYIGKDELFHTLTSLGHCITLGDIDEIMTEINTAKKGVISFEEFCILMKTPSMDTARALPTRRKSIVTETTPKRNSLAVDNEYLATPKSSPRTTSASPSKGLHGRRHSTGVESSEPLPSTPSRNPTTQTGFSLRRLFGGRPKSPKPEKPIEKKEPVASTINFADQASVEDMRAVFDMFDVNKDSFLSVNEFKLVSSKLGIGIIMEDNEVRQLFNLVDNDRDGLISFDEFVKLFNIS